MTVSLRVITNSELTVHRRCKREHCHSYVQGYRPIERSAALDFGTRWHAGMEVWWRGESPGGDDVGAAIDAAVQGCEDAYEAAKLCALLIGYDARWAPDHDQASVVAVEAEFRFPMRMYSGVVFGGKVDVLTTTGIVEHKSSSDDIDAGSAYWRQLTLNSQVSTYYQGARALGVEPLTCTYDVVKKPTIKPLNIPLLDSDGVKIVHDVDGERVRTKDGKKWRETGDTKLGYVMQTKQETPEEYGERLLADISNNPGFYYQRGEVVRLAEEERDSAADMWTHADTMLSDIMNDRFPKNPDACRRYGRFCDFFDVCCNEASLDDTSKFRKLESMHEELSKMTFTLNTTTRHPQQARTAVKPATAPSTMTLSSVQRGFTASASRLLIYGVGGVGKTTFAAESTSPIFIDTQDGSGRLDVARFPCPTTWTDVLAAIATLTSETHEYKTVVLDLLDDLEAMAWNHVCVRDEKANIETYGYGKGFKVALVEWRVLLASLERLRTVKGMNVIFVAHAGIKSFKNPEGEDYDRYGLQLHDGAAGLIRGWCDTVLFARHETAIKVDPRKRVRGISTGARVVHTVETAAYYAKNRDNLPDTIALDYAEFKAAVDAGVPARAEDILAEIARLSDGLDEDTLKKVESATRLCDGCAAALARVLNRLKEISTRPAQETET